jgi:hypothetical protein
MGQDFEHYGEKTSEAPTRSVGVKRLVSLQKVRACIEEILREATVHPDDCLECIANNALCSAKIPLVVEKSSNDEEPYPVRVAGWVNI